MNEAALDCDKFKTGKFELESKYGDKILIKRTNKFQTETICRNENVVRYKIKWLNECSLILYGRQLLKGTEEIPDIQFREKFDADTIFNEIIEIKGNQYITKSKFKHFPDVFESTTRKVN